MEQELQETNELRLSYWVYVGKRQCDFPPTLQGGSLSISKSIAIHFEPCTLRGRLKRQQVLEVNWSVMD